MCNCRKGAKKTTSTSGQDQQAEAKSMTQTFAFIPPTGPRQSYGSRLEAEAARVRAGRVGRIERNG